jgi:hypothetical protein
MLTVEILVNPKRLLYGHPAPARVSVDLAYESRWSWADLARATRLHLPRTIRGHLKVAVTAANTAGLGSITVVGRSG